MNQVINIKQFLQQNIDGLLQNKYTYVDIKYEDNNVIRYTYTESILIHYILNVPYKYYLDITFTIDDDIRHFYKNDYFNIATINSMFTHLTRKVFKPLEESLNIDKHLLENYFKDVYYVFNAIYNVLVFNNLNNVVSVNILDFLEIQYHPRLLKAIEQVKKDMTIQSINNAYEVLEDLMYNEPLFKDNILAELYRADILSKLQFKQMTAPRGFVTEVNSKIYKIPIANSFILGMTNLYDIAVESRTAAKALLQSTKSISDSEAFTRKLQLATMVVEKVIYTDCGNTDYIEWYVRGEEKTAGGYLTHKCDLPNLVGKWYLDDDGKWKVISIYDEHLIGKTIKLRSVKHCKLKNPHHICVKCLGTIGYNIPQHSNLGHVASTELGSPTGQLILSTKHYSGSAGDNEIYLDNIGKKFLQVNKDGFSLKLEVLKKYKSVQIIIPQNDIFGLFDINLEKLNAINTESVSKINSILLEVDGELYPIEIKQQSRYGVFTKKFLEYIVKTGYQIDDKNRVHIDLTKWRYKTQIIYLPNIEFSFVAFAAEIEKLTIGNKLNRKNIDFENAVSQLFNLANTKIDINISLIEVIMYAFTIRDREKNDFRLGRGVKNPELTTLNEIMSQRSLGVALGYDNLMKKFLSPDSYFEENRQDHIMDVLIMPNEVLKK